MPAPIVPAPTTPKRSIFAIPVELAVPVVDLVAKLGTASAVRLPAFPGACWRAITLPESG